MTITGTATVTGIMDTIMGMIGMAITVITMIGLTVGTMAITTIGIMITGPDGLTVAVMAPVGILGMELMLQDTPIRPTSASTLRTAGIPAITAIEP